MRHISYKYYQLPGAGGLVLLGLTDALRYTLKDTLQAFYIWRKIVVIGRGYII